MKVSPPIAPPAGHHRAVSSMTAPWSDISLLDIGGGYSVHDLDLHAAVVACTPFLNAIHGPHRDALMEATGGEDVAELNNCLQCRVPAGKITCHDIPRIRRFVHRARLCLSSVWHLRPYELQPNGRHPHEHGPVACLPVWRSAAIAIAMQDVEVTGR